MDVTENLGSADGFVRSLGPFEELYWLYSQRSPRGFAYAMEVEGTTSVSAWRQALAAFQQSQPLFNVAIEPNPGGVPFFREVEKVEIPLRLVDGLSGERWVEEMAREVNTPIPGDSAPLMRAVLLQDATRSVLIVTTHHSISDGISMSAALGELFGALVGRSPARHALLKPVEEQLGIPPITRGSVAKALPTFHSVVLDDRATPPKVEILKLDAGFTARLAARARQEGTTVHGALCSAVIMAGRKLLPKWERTPVKILSDIDQRPMAGVGKSSALYFGAGVLAIEPDAPEDFWPLACRFTEALAQQRQPEVLRKVAEVMTQVVASGMGVEQAVGFLATALAFDAIISNLGRLDIETTGDGLKLTSIWGSSLLTGLADEQIIGVSTLNGQMNLAYTSHTHAAGLLRAMAKLFHQVS